MLKSFLNEVLITLLKKDSNTDVSCGTCEIVKNNYFEEHLQTTASETCSFNWTALFDNLQFWLKLVPMLWFLHHNLQFCLPILPSLLLILL